MTERELDGAPFIAWRWSATAHLFRPAQDLAASAAEWADRRPGSFAT